MKKLLLSLALLMPTMTWADTTIAEKDWSLGSWLISNEDVGATCKMTSGGLAITNPGVQEEAWTPQAIVLDGFSLKKGHDYTVRMEVKIPASGKLQVNMGGWDFYEQYVVSVKKKTDSQIIDVDFPEYGETFEGDAHVLFQNGKIKGTTVLQEIQVLDVTTGDTTLVAENQFWFGDEDTGSTCKVTDNGLSIKNPQAQTDYWTPQTLALYNIKLQQNHTYKVIFDAKVPSNGYLYAQLGSWGFFEDHSIYVEGSNEFQEYEFCFENFPVDLEDGHVLFQNGEIKGTCVLRSVRVIEVAGKVKLNKTKATIEKGKTLKLKATVTPTYLEDKSVTWQSSDTKVAKVSSSGKVTAVKAGTATITCTSNATSAKATCKVTVGYVKLDKAEAVVQKGKTVTLKAAVYPSSLKDQSVIWESSNTKIATVTSKGKVKGVKAGKAAITCTSVATGLSATCVVTVGYVSLDQTEVSVKKGKTVTLKAEVYPLSLEDKSVTWVSSNTKVATVTSAGKVKGVKAGSAAIKCISNATGLSATCIVTVTTSAGSRSMDGDDDDETTGIEEKVVAVEPFDVYDLGGRKVLHQVTSLDGLPDGIYIVNGKKILKKK